MITKYIKSAMNEERFEILQDENSCYGEIPGFDGVYANTKDLETCKIELEEVLEEWLFFRISKNLSVPKVNGAELKIKKIAV